MARIIDAALDIDLGACLRSMYETEPDALVMIDRDQCIVLLNAQAEVLFGYQRDELIGRDVELLIPERFRARHRELRGAYALDPHPRTSSGAIELFCLHQDGHEIPVEVSLNPYVSDSGAIYISSAVRDITDRKRSQEKFRILLEAVPDAMAILDSRGAIVVVNEQCEALFGYQREEMLGQDFEMLIPERWRGWDAESRQRFFGAPTVGPKIQGVELYCQRKDGSEFPVEFSLNPMQTDDGILISSTVRDITERKRAEEEASHFRSVIESSHDAIIGMDLDGIITSWNAGALRLYGYTAEEAIGKSLSVLVPPGHDDEMSDVMPRVIAGEQIDHYESVRERKDGTQVDVSLTISAIRDSKSAVIGASTIARDIGVRLRYQEQLRQLSEKDALTGLRNRRRFERDISDQVGRAHRYGEFATLLIIDLNGFKSINDRYGHRMGDRALKVISTALRRRLRDNDIVARIGGDEFAVLMPYARMEDATQVADDLRDVVSSCTIAGPDGVEVRLSASIGMAQIDRDTPSDDAVMGEADRLMYREKDEVRVLAALG